MAAAPQLPVDIERAARALRIGAAGVPRLLALLCNPQVATAAVLEALRSEPTLAARVLKVANSPYYRCRGEVGTLQRAQQMLGLSALRGIAAAACLDRMAPPRAGQAFDPQRLRRHSLAVAVAAQQLSGATRAGVDGEAFMAGLLHDIGVLLLAQADPTGMAAYQPSAAVHEADALQAERDHFGTEHAQAAGLLVQSWSLPDWLLAPLSTHHQASAAPSAMGLDALPALVALADHLADRAGFQLWPAGALSPDATPLAALGLTAETLDSLAAALPAQVEQLLAPP